MISIVTDSTCDLSPDLRAKHNITVIPQKVIFGTTVYRDGVDLTNEKFYTMLTTLKEHPTTSQASPGEFVDIYRPLIDAGKEIVSLHLSSKLSGTYASAVAAKTELESQYKKSLPITIVDTPWVSMALGMLAMTAAQAASAGKSRDEVVSAVNALSSKINIIFLLDTLEYLKRGGRIGAARALLGTALNVKPMLTLKNGAVEPLEQPRTRAKALRRLMEIVQERNGTKPLHVAVLNAQAADEAATLGSDLKAKFDCKEFYSCEIGPVLGVHVGPGTLGVAFYGE